MRNKTGEAAVLVKDNTMRTRFACFNISLRKFGACFGDDVFFLNKRNWAFLITHRHRISLGLPLSDILDKALQLKSQSLLGC